MKPKANLQAWLTNGVVTVTLYDLTDLLSLYCCIHSYLERCIGAFWSPLGTGPRLRPSFCVHVEMELLTWVS